MKVPDKCFLVFMFFLLCFILTQKGNSQNLTASVTKKNITPADSKYLLGYGTRKSEGVLDSIYHQVLILNDGNSKFVLVSTDICVISPSEYDRVASMVKKNFNIEPKNFWWTVTHTHSAPEVGPPGLPEIFLGERYKHEQDKEYTDFVANQLLEGIKEGLENMTSSKLGVGWGYSSANINRRARDIDDIAFLGMNPDGPVDRRIGLIKIISGKDNSPLAVIANYPIHGTVLGSENRLISGDAPGVVTRYVEEKIGAPLLFINGAAGNIAPIYSTYPNHQAGRLNQFRRLLGDKIIAAYEDINVYEEDINLTVSESTFQTPLKEGLGWPSDLGGYLTQSSEGESLIKVPIRYVGINHKIGIWGSPLELFCEIANTIRDKSPFPYTFFFGYTNGWLGYMLTKEELQYKGYESTVSPFTHSAGERFKEAVVSYLESELLSN